MSQIRVSSLTSLRGRAYKCLHCRGNSPCIGEKRRVEAHVYKTHVPLENSPFYCKLCTFRCTAQDDLEKHVHSFKPHGERAAQQGDDFNDEDCLMRSDTPYYVTSADMLCLSVEESEKIWQKRRKYTPRHNSPVKAYSAPVPLSSPPSVHRNLGTPIQDENIWDAIMGPSQYSSHMTLTPTPRGLQTPVSARTPARILAQHVADVTSSSLLPSVGTLISSSVMSVPRPITSVVTASSINLPSVYSPVSPFVIPTCAELPPLTPNLSLQATLPRPFPSATVPTTLIQQPCISTTFQPMPSSPVLTNSYDPLFPALDQNSYVPTPITTTPAENPKIQRQSTAQQTDEQPSTAVSSQTSSKELVAAVNDLNRTIRTCLASVSKAIENQTLLLGAMNQQFKNFIRNNEDEIRKRKREEEPKEKDKRRRQ